MDPNCVDRRTTVRLAKGKSMSWQSKLLAALLASFSGAVSAQGDCKAVPPGPDRTDCYLALSEYYRAQSDLAAAKARAEADAAWYRAITGAAPSAHKPHRSRSLRNH